jgi:hypothetical protein
MRYLLAWLLLWALAYAALVWLPCFEGERRGTRLLRHAVLLLGEPWHLIRRLWHHAAGIVRELYPR